MGKENHSVQIRNLLKAALDDQELTVFCYDHFREVYENFSADMGRLVKIQLLIDYCDRYGKSDELLELIRKTNPHQFGKYELVASNLNPGTQLSKTDNRGMLEVKLEGDFTSLSNEQLEIVLSAFTGALAGVLDVNRQEIEITEVKKGSIVLKLNMPAAALIELVQLYEANSPLVEELGIQQIESTSSKKILWVDDNPFNNIFERSFLQSLGISLVFSTSTEDALEKLSIDNYDAIISDMGRPPDMRAGYTLLAEIQNREIDIPFIVYSSSNNPKFRLESREKGAFGNTASPTELFELVISALMNS